ncbi:MAG: MAPEG family protein [Alphaproteobacteria bacterium]|nr:MAPEG family protein [Alphaproteobacteria bacterium]
MSLLIAKYTMLVTVASVVLVLVLTARVGMLRGRTGVAAPATSGHPDFERAYRIHLNTVEQLVLFLPVLWLSVPVVGDLWTGVLGALWLAGRIVYVLSYTRDPATRGAGMMITLGVTTALALIALAGAIRLFMLP